MTAISRENLKQAFLLDITEEFSNIPDDLPFEPSKSFERKMENLIKRSRKPYYKYTATGLRRAVCVIAAILILMLSSLSVGAVRETLRDFFVKVFPTYDVISYNGKSTDKKDYPKELDKVYELGNIPTGFELVDCQIDKSSATYLYFSGGKQIVFEQVVKEKYVSAVDNEYTIRSVETLDGQEYMIFTSTNSDIISFVWDDGEYIFDLSGNLNKNEMFNLCKSLKQQDAVK